MRGSLFPPVAAGPHFRSGNSIPATIVVHKPVKMSIEGDCAAIRDAAGPDACHRASNDASTNGHATAAGCEVKLDCSAWKHSTGALDQHASG
jgi:hypothetical protein